MSRFGERGTGADAPLALSLPAWNVSGAGNPAPCAKLMPTIRKNFRITVARLTTKHEDSFRPVEAG